MIPNEYNIEKLKEAIGIGSQSGLRFACDFADRIVAAVVRLGDEESLPTGFSAFRARAGFREEELEPDTGQVFFHPHREKEVCAPPPEITKLNRFNSPHHPVLYLSTTPEVALAEIRALSSDMSTVATFQTVRPNRIAKLLRHNAEPLELFLQKQPDEELLEKWLIARTAEFVSRGVASHDRDTHYRTCNLVASAFKERGFDGLAYRTSYWSPGWRDDSKSEDEDHIRAANIVLFDAGSAIPKRSALYRISWKRPSSELDGSVIWRAKPEGS